MSQVLKDFVDVLKKLHGPDLAALGVSLQWELTLGGGEKISGVGLSKLGIGMDRDAGVLYSGVVFGPGDLVAPQGQSAKTKSRLQAGHIYGEVSSTWEGIFMVCVVPLLGPLGELLAALQERGLSAHLVSQFNGWSIGQENRLCFSEAAGYWSIGQAIGKETLAKIAIPLSAGWRAEWDSGHHAPGALQSLTLRPPAEAVA